MNNNAYILFTRVPVPNKVKTRLQSMLSGEEACQVQLSILKDSFTKFTDLPNKGIDLYLAYSDEGDSSTLLSELPSIFQPFQQKGTTIGERMNYAIETVFSRGYEKVVLTGSDIPNLTSQKIYSAFEQMKEVVFGPSLDGGYYLVGCKQSIDLTPIFEKTISWGENMVLNESLKQLKTVHVAFLPYLQDIDHPGDLKKIRYELESENQHLSRWIKENRGLFE